MRLAAYRSHQMVTVHEIRIEPAYINIACIYIGIDLLKVISSGVKLDARILIDHYVYVPVQVVKLFFSDETV